MSKKPFICVDLFCGAGGTSTGMLKAAAALGTAVQLLAVNHWDVAIATHTANHPQVTHMCETVDGADPRVIVPGGHLHLLVASPECTHFSSARGGKPKDPQKRATPWHILRWCDALNVENLLIENVPEFKTWGPLHKCSCGAKEDAEHPKNCLIGQPIKAESGLYYRNFISNLEVLGYTVEDRILTCYEYGDPTSRKRLFIQARLGSAAPVWPEATHAPASEAATRGMKSWRVARDIIDWELKGISIYDRPRHGRKPLVAATMKRIHAGVYKFAGLPFIVPQFSDSDPRSVDQPMGSMTTTSRGTGLCQPFLVVLRNGQDGFSLEHPCPSILTRNQFGVAVPTIKPFLTSSGGPAGQIGPFSLDDPMGTVLTKDFRTLVQPYIAPITHQGEGNRCRSVDDPLFTVTGAKWGELALIEPLLQPYMIVNRNNADAHSMEEPMRGLAGSNIMGVAEPSVVTDALDPFLVKYYEGSDAVSVDVPLHSVTANYEHLALIEPFLTNYHGSHEGRNDGDGRVLPVGKPLPTLDTSNRLGIAEPFLVNYNGTGGAHSLDEPIDSVTGNDRFALVAPEYVHLIDKGDVVGYLDILYRMLQPHELAGGQGFPKSYIFTGTREHQIKQIGNAVPVHTAEALCSTIFKTILSEAV